MKTTLITTFAIAVMVFAFNTNPAMAGGNSDTQHTLWSSNQQEVDELKDLDETDVARYQPDFEWKWERDPGTGNYGWTKRYMNESGAGGEQVAEMEDETGDESEVALGGCVTDWSSGRTVCCYPSSSGRGVACHYPNEEGKESEIAYGCKPRPDGSVHCPGDAWNTENDESELAGLTRRQKQQQDEDDWNAWILKQFAGLTRRQKQQQDEDDWNAWILKQFAGLTRRQKQQQDEDDWNAWILKQFALPYTPTDECDPYAAGAYCPAGNEDEGAAEQREFAAGAQGGSFSAAGLTLGGLPTEADGTAAATEDSLNDRVLRSGHY
ncbi:MAG: hypothetical protein OXF09_01975 [Hyphomicrobiales bacterium]|nr:hypothetical protein [Hyphomicrobiales bacterium]